ncbi:SusC/RagA family TonB-linked outer membrane protein [Proteiniphilum acetatigenes]|uniref:SusC/RagA family TonB-linked outer membrane protein n=1 Tax=Proteiniphilum acetatigenes TaxID=294710 RepID=UPI000372ACBE|nr:iron complex outermembrane recepter protein [Porphyromonadaceae bacterium KH3CP3RA]
MQKQMKFNIMNRTFFLLGFLFLLSVNAFSQQQTINGTVTDEAGEAIIGANVTVKGTTNGTITDFNGAFTLTNVPIGSTLLFSYIGYITREVEFTGTSPIHVVMQENIELLGEVVVIGYGAVKKDDLTGSVAVIQPDLEGRGLSPNPQDMLVGKIPGVQIVSSGGSPSGGATIRIRGGSSLSANNDPLIVVDGIPLAGGPGGVGNMLSTINPTDIETFTVLKDASATAIYGSRASNGVILITTRKGVSGKVRFNYDANVSVSQRRKGVDVLTGDEFRSFIQETFAGLSNEAEVVGKLGTANTDWQDAIFRTGYNTEHNLSAFGSYKEMMPYRASFGYTNLNGILKTSNMERFTGSISLNPQLLDKHLSVNLNARGMYIKNRFADQGAIGAAIAMDPTQPVYDENSPYGGYWSWIGNDGKILGVSTKNPVSLLEMRHDTSKGYQFVGNAQVDYKLHFFPKINFNLNLGMDYSNTNGENATPHNAPAEANAGGYQNNWENKRNNSLLDFYGQYKTDMDFLESNLDIMGGYSWQHFWWENNNLAIRTAPERYGEVIEDNAPFAEEYYLLSFFGRLNWNVYNKYLFTFTVRQDGSSRFNKDNRWGLFPAAAFAWRLNEEDFMRDFTNLSNLKLRLGWGLTGQQDIGYTYPAIRVYQNSVGEAANYYRDGEWVTLIKPLSYNADLKWETTTTWNAGIDYGFFNNRVNGTIDVYRRETRDLLNREVKVAAGSNFSEYVVANIGTLENIGTEFSLNVVPIATRDWNWEAGFNFAYNKNEITALTYNDQSAMNRFGNTGGDGGFNLLAHAVGHPHSMYYVYEQVYDEAGKPIEGMYVDRNNDGQINEEDLYLYHKFTPDWTLGFNTKLNWKSWDLSIASHGSIGNYNYNAIAANNAELAPARVYANEFLSNRHASAFDTNFQYKRVLSDYYIQNASFFRIDNITLGYSFNEILGHKAKTRLSLAVQNPFVFTKYQGLDPEVFGGVDNNFYPRPVTILFGLNVNF